MIKLIRGILGVLLVLGVVGYLTSCVPDVDEAIEDATEQCEKIAARERTAALEQCQAILEGELDGFKLWLEWFLEKEKTQTFIDLGCVPDASELGWDCSGSVICE
jgi:hypothetical protein